jgi:3-oxoacyl-[acyl-carrier protein] reductase
LEGKVAMVSAGSKGIGLATAQMLSAEGCRISLCGRSEEHLTSASDSIEGECDTYVVDVSNPDDLSWWFEQTCADIGKPEILITNTGGPATGSLKDLTDEQWEAGVQSTLMNVVRLGRLVSPAMVENNWGRIVHITSLVAKDPSPMLPISSTIRAGLRALTKLQAKEYGPNGITVNSVLPGHTLTDRQRHLADLKSQQTGITIEQAYEQTASEIPLGRMARPEEVASVIVFLCSAQASYISGINLLVDGGLTQSID